MGSRGGLCSACLGVTVSPTRQWCLAGHSQLWLEAGGWCRLGPLPALASLVPSPCPTLADQPPPPSRVGGVASTGPSLLFFLPCLGPGLAAGLAVGCRPGGGLGVAAVGRGEGTPGPDGGDSVFPSRPQPLVAAQEFPTGNELQLQAESGLAGVGSLPLCSPGLSTGPDHHSGHRRTPRVPWVLGVAQGHMLVCRGGHGSTRLRLGGFSEFEDLPSKEPHSPFLPLQLG